MIDLSVIIRELPHVLTALGVKELAYADEKMVSARTSLVNFTAKIIDQALRLEIVLLNDAFVNKALLWHLININSLFAPFGQFYVSPNKDVALGCFIPKDNIWLNYWERIIFELFSCAESYYSLLNKDLCELPFDERNLAPDWSELIKSSFHWGKEVSLMDRNTATFMLERLFADSFATRYQIIRMNDYEFALVDDWITHIQIVPMPQARRYQHVTDWFLGLWTEIGQLNHTDTALLIKLNRKNYDFFATSLTVNYENQKPVLSIQTELIADTIQQPNLLAHSLAHHSFLAQDIFEEFKDVYKIKVHSF